MQWLTSLQLQNTGTLLLAAAILRAFPKARWANNGLRGDSFFVDFYFPAPFDHKITAEVIQQSLRDLLDAEPTLALKEMLWGNAQSYLKHTHGHWPESEEERDGKELITLAEINKLPFFAHLPLVNSIEEIAACRLWDTEPLPAEDSPYENLRPIRFYGFAVADKKDLSTLQKKLTKAKRRNATQIGQEMGLFLPPDNPLQRWLWLPKGYAWRKDLLEKVIHCAESQPVEGFAPIDPIEQEEELLAQHLICAAHSLKKGQSLPLTFSQTIQTIHHPTLFASGWGLYDSFSQTSHVGHGFFFEGNSQEGVISSLQRIEKTYKMLAIEYYWVFRLPKPKRVLEPAIWNKKKRYLEEALQFCGLQGEYLPSLEGQTGPQAELMACDSFGKPWMLASVTLDALGQALVDDYMHHHLRGFKQSITVIRMSFLESLERLCAFLLESKITE